MTSLETVFAALYAKLTGITDFETVGRRIMNAQDLQPEQFPAAFQVQGKQTWKFTPDSPPVLTLRALWALYTFQSDKTASPSTPLNLLLDAARAAMQPPGGQIKQTLGGLVEFAAIQGDVEIFEDAQGERAIALLPIAIVMPGW